MDGDILTEKEAAALLRCSPSALLRFRCERRGPPYSKVGKLVRYTRSDLIAWLESRRVEPEGVATRAANAY